MALFGTRGKSSPRLMPQLDDNALGKVWKQLQAPTMVGIADMNVDAVERLVQETETDWDRRWHRLSVLAELTADSNFAESWLRRRPRSADALVFDACVAAERVRRGEPNRDLPAAVQACYKAREARPENPLPLVALLGLLRLLRGPAHQVEQVWREAARLDPWNREAHLQLLGYLSPEECGRPGQAREFLEYQCTRMPADAPAIGLELTAAVRDFRRATAGDGVNAILADLWWGRPGATAALNRATTLWTRPGFLRHAAALADLNLLAYCLVHAARTDDAEPVFRMIGPAVAAWPWGEEGEPVEQFRHWRARALR